MALSDNDLEKISKIVDEKVSGLEVKMNQGFGELGLDMNQRFDEASSENKSEHREIINKIEQVKQMETEDVQVLYKDVALLKKKMAV